MSHEGQGLRSPWTVPLLVGGMLALGLVSGRPGDFETAVIGGVIGGAVGAVYYLPGFITWMASRRDDAGKPPDASGGD